MLEVYGTYPSVRGATPDSFVAPILDVARWSESAGMRGLLVFTDNDTMDPWAAAQFLLERTATLVPLVALTLLFGVYPKPVLDMSAASVQLLVNNYATAVTAVKAAALLQ